ncbi:hypothetical protein KIW84_045764 [Lathyrus oleraceus]|uniref:PB1-like domain-containing protein n=1 Tax=Pisum sativum TaxID=3888 RepID=A0A9D4XP20_PEA|nr:hypothetical protein KIW84_045764 [Pisum sativum]
MQLLNVIFHHGGEFVRVNEKDILYIGGVHNIFSMQHIGKWTMFKIHKLVKGWGCKEGSYKAWMKILEVNEFFFQLSKDDDAYDFVVYTCATQVDGDVYLEHDVNDIELKVKSPKFIIEMINMEGFDDKGVEGFDDSEDERTTTITYGFDGIDVNLPINKCTIVVGFLYSSNKKIEDDEHVGDELEYSNLDKFDEDKWPKFEKFRKNKLNRDYKFKWGMEFNFLADFRDAIQPGQDDAEPGQTNVSQVEVEPSLIDASQVEPSLIDASQVEPTRNLFDYIPDEVMAIIHDINTYARTNKGKAKVQKVVVKMRKRASERLTLKWF